jgi:hypothetical protein
MNGSTTWLCLAALVLSACRGEEERDVSREVASVAHAVNQLREAPHNAKETPLQHLTSITCKSAPACELQQVCVSAYRLHAEAVQMGVQASQQGSAGYGPQLTADLLARAEKQLADAKVGAERCVALEGEFTRRYKL